MKYIHYGCKSFQRERFMPIRNRERGFITKPYGGFWASPVSTRYGWKDFCVREDFEADLTQFFTFTLSKKARVLKIKSFNDLAGLPRISVEPFEDEVYLDFESLAKRWDAIEVTFYGGGIFHRKRKSYDLVRALRFWDCDSLLVLNPDVVCS